MFASETGTDQGGHLAAAVFCLGLFTMCNPAEHSCENKNEKKKGAKTYVCDFACKNDETPVATIPPPATITSIGHIDQQKHKLQ